MPVNLDTEVSVMILLYPCRDPPDPSDQDPDRPVGLPGSGKSTLLGQVLPHSGFRHGADDVRRTMFGDVSTQGNPAIVHEAARHMLLVRMTEGLPSAYDATNLTVRERQNLLVMADQNDYYTVALIGQVSMWRRSATLCDPNRCQSS